MFIENSAGLLAAGPPSLTLDEAFDRVGSMGKF